MYFYLGRLLAFLTNMGQILKGLPGANTLAYYEHSKNTDVKCFITLGPGRGGSCRWQSCSRPR
jgi:hypothetical protein